MNIVIYANDPLVFRDGRPFGDAGHVNDGVILWPWPSTIAGVLRTRIGLNRDKDFFAKTSQKENIGAIKKVHINRVLPLWRADDSETWQHLFPAPADALVVEDGERDEYRIYSYSYEDPFEGGGINLAWKNWRIPVAETAEKPASDAPAFWYEDKFFAWLRHGSVPGPIKAKDLGFSWPALETRMHTAIDPETGTVKTGQLFSSSGIRMETQESEREAGGRFGIGAELTGLLPSDTPEGNCLIGGERRVAYIERIENRFPSCPDWFENARFLRLILISPGDFGAWAPSWLIPDKDRDETNWSRVPGTDIDVRLCSAFVPRWRPISGWDYEKQAPKATRKLVPAGAVYVIEIKDSSRSRDLAGLLWGRSLNENPDDQDGFGCVCIGNCSIND